MQDEIYPEVSVSFGVAFAVFYQCLNILSPYRTGIKGTKFYLIQYEKKNSGNEI